jgi:D-alanine-D-alanine ligase
MRVAVVCNRDFDGVINRFGQASPEVYGERTVQMVVESLGAAGHEVVLLEGDKTLLTRLEEFMPADSDGQPTGIVFNMAYGIQGECRYTHVPAMLEMAGVPYTGSGPFGHALALDKVITKILMQHAGIPTPRFVITSGTIEAGLSSDTRACLKFPLVIKPRHESTSYGLHLAYNAEEAAAAVASVVEQYQQDALVEEYIDGREFCVGLIGNEEIEFLPIIESDFGGRETRIVTWADKFMQSDCEPEKICPARVDENLAARLREISLATFRACHCKDFARVDIRVDADDTPYVLEINSMASLGRTGSFVLAAQTAGYDFAAMINRILDEAHSRYFGAPAPRSPRVESVVVNV